MTAILIGAGALAVLLFVRGLLLVGGCDLSLVCLLPIHFRLLIVNEFAPRERNISRGVLFYGCKSHPS